MVNGGDMYTKGPSLESLALIRIEDKKRTLIRIEEKKRKVLLQRCN